MELRALRLMARHGVGEEEKSLLQPFEIDLDIELDLSRCVASDELSATVDYAAVLMVVEAVFQGEPVNLLETLAARVGRAVLELAPMAGAVVVAVRKLRPPVPHEIASAGVRLRVEADR